MIESRRGGSTAPDIHLLDRVATDRHVEQWSVPTSVRPCRAYLLDLGEDRSGLQLGPSDGL